MEKNELCTLHANLSHTIQESPYLSDVLSWEAVMRLRNTLSWCAVSSSLFVFVLKTLVWL